MQIRVLSRVQKRIQTLKQNTWIFIIFYIHESISSDLALFFTSGIRKEQRKIAQKVPKDYKQSALYIPLQQIL